MIDDQLAEMAALYAAGALTADERELFEPLLEFHEPLHEHVASLLATAAATAVAHPPTSRPQPCPTVKSRVMAATEDSPQFCGRALVVTGPDRRVQWVNGEFSAMCGYARDELAGKSLGPILQGAKTDRAVADRMRSAVREGRACHETLLNYRKDGTPYWVEIDIRPFLDEAGGVRWFIAHERERPNLALP